MFSGEEGADTIQTDGCPTQTSPQNFPGVRIGPVVDKSDAMAHAIQTPSEVETLYLDSEKTKTESPPKARLPPSQMGQSSEEAASLNTQPKKKSSKLKQQELPIWQPIVTVRTILPYLFLIGVVFIPTGIGFMYASDQVRELELDYTYCSGADKNSERTPRCDSTNSSSEQVSCQIPLDNLNMDWSGHVFVYYGLDNLFQNHRLYVKSRDDKQLKGDVAKEVDDNCKPFDKDENGTKYLPCGAVANNMFNDTIKLKYSSDGGGNWQDVPLSKKGIALPSDKSTKFANPEKLNDQESLKDAFRRVGGDFVKPRDWTKNIWELDLEDESNNGFQNEDFLVWMRTATLSSFRKLYRKVGHQQHEQFKQGLPKKFEYRIDVECHYNVAQFNGKKKVILSTTSVLGGKNNFLGVMYVLTGSLCFLLGLFFLILNKKYGVVDKQLKQKL